MKHIGTAEETVTVEDSFEAESTLSMALMLLQEVGSLLDDMTDLDLRKKLPVGYKKKITAMSDEVYAFLSEAPTDAEWGVE
jgi:hypothetical protein